MGARWDRLRSKFAKLRGVADMQTLAGESGTTVRASQAEYDRIAQIAAKSCSWICREAIKRNMASAGISSSCLVKAIDQGEAVYWPKRGVVRFRLAPNFGAFAYEVKGKNGKSYRYTSVTKKGKQIEGGIYMVAAAQDAGRVIGIKAQAARVKRTIKAGLEARLGKVVQVHNGRTITREAIDKAGVKVVKGKDFFKFTTAQEAQIQAHFRRNFFGLAKKYGYEKNA